MIQLNQNKVQIKYITGINKTFPGYPTPMDVLYESCVECVDDCLFSSEKMEDRYGLSVEEIEKIIGYLLDNKFIEKKNSKYKIVNTIWQH